MSESPSNLVRLLVGGQEYGGWKSVRIGAGIERQARDFDLEVTDRWPGQTGVPRRIQPGDACQVFIGQDLVLTGYVDATPIRYDGRSVSVAVRGRSKTADLVDCCPLPSGKAIGCSAGGGKQPWGDVKGPDGKLGTVVPAPAKSASQWRNNKLEAIAATLASPYGVRVITEIDTGKVITDHQVQVGETVFESIDRMMRIRHVLSTDNERGDLVFIDVGSAGSAGTAIETGKNVLSCSTDLDYKGVFSDYIVKGQRAGSDDAYASDASEEEGDASDDEAEGQGEQRTNAIGQSATSTDARAKRRRILVIKQSGQADDGTCKDRADYERAHRAAKALQTTYTLTGWRQEDGSLWRPNLLVRVRDAVVGFNVQMVIAEVAYVLNAQGLRTELKVGPVDGYRSKAGQLKKSKSQKGGGQDWSDTK